jgi:hypothetical protein
VKSQKEGSFLVMENIFIFNFTFHIFEAKLIQILIQLMRKLGWVQKCKVKTKVKVKVKVKNLIFFFSNHRKASNRYILNTSALIWQNFDTKSNKTPENYVLVDISDAITKRAFSYLT